MHTINIFPRHLFFLVFFLLTTAQAVAQPFRPDQKGYVSDPKFHQLIKKRGYELTGSFSYTSIWTENGAETKMAAPVMKNGEWIYIDLNGKELESAELQYAAEPAQEAYEGQSYDVQAPDYRNYEMIPQDKARTVIPAEEKTIEKPETKSKPKKRKPAAPEKIIVMYDLDNLRNENGRYKAIIITDSAQSVIAYGLKDPLGNWVLQPAYDYLVVIANNNRAILAQSGGCYGLYSLPDGKELVPPTYSIAEALTYDSRYPDLPLKVKLNGKWGLLTTEGKEIVAPQFDRIALCEENPAFLEVTRGGKKGILDASSGKILIQTLYDRINWEWNVHGAIVNNNGLSGLVDFEGHELLPPVYTNIWQLGDGLFMVNEERCPELCKQGIYDFFARKMVVAPVFTSASVMDGKKVIRVSLERGDHAKYGLVDLHGNTVLPAIYDKISDRFPNNFIELKTGEFYGMADETGKVKIEPAYESLDLAFTGGSEVFDGTDWQTEQQKIYVLAGKSGKMGLLDGEGKELVPFLYESIRVYADCLVARLNGSDGVLDLNGKKTTIGFSYKQLNPDMKGIFFGEKNGRSFLLDFYGHSVCQD